MAPQKLLKSIACAALGVALAAGTASVQASTVAYVIPYGTSGNQSWSGALGMDFDVNQPIAITSLGVFDSPPDGIFDQLKAYIYDRTDGSILATLTFTSNSPGTRIGGSFFKPLATPLILDPGFKGSIVAEGFSTDEKNGNWNANNPKSKSWTTDDSAGAISFVGHGRWSNVAGVYPADPGSSWDYLPPDVFAAGSFQYELRPLAESVPLPGAATAGLFGLSLVIGRSLVRRSRR